mmetsp:Transcript_12435/g.23332  ORF Transcript_12435/g.23332 Transcript_12435/m.23332 type:complete len:92 (-) Transcript_12435:654-929(-)
MTFELFRQEYVVRWTLTTRKSKQSLKISGLHEFTYRTIFASLDLSSKWAASTADTIAPSSADRSQYSSETRNLLAKLKNAAGFLDALTAMT